MLELWGMRSNPALLLFQGSLWLGMVEPDKVLSMNQIEMFDIYTVCKQMPYAKLNCLK